LAQPWTEPDEHDAIIRSKFPVRNSINATAGARRGDATGARPICSPLADASATPLCRNSPTRSPPTSAPVSAKEACFDSSSSQPGAHVQRGVQAAPKMTYRVGGQVQDGSYKSDSNYSLATYSPTALNGQAQLRPAYCRFSSIQRTGRRHTARRTGSARRRRVHDQALLWWMGETRPRRLMYRWKAGLLVYKY